MTDVEAGGIYLCRRDIRVQPGTRGGPVIKRGSRMICDSEPDAEQSEVMLHGIATDGNVYRFSVPPEYARKHLRAAPLLDDDPDFEALSASFHFPDEDEDGTPEETGVVMTGEIFVPGFGPDQPIRVHENVKGDLYWSGPPVAVQWLSDIVETVLLRRGLALKSEVSQVVSLVTAYYLSPDGYGLVTLEEFVRRRIVDTESPDVESQKGLVIQLPGSEN